MKKLLAKNTKLKQINLKKIKHDPNFLSTIKILNSNKIPYWACHGTLLGIIRDKKLIEWDHDIDIAVWSFQVKKEKIKKLMEKENFKIRPGYLIKDDLVSFDKSGGRVVDINFYELLKSNNKITKAFVRFRVPKNNLMKLLDALSLSKKYQGKYKFLINLFFPLKTFFFGIKNFLIKNNFFYKEIGYSEPYSYIGKTQTIKFKGLKIKIPIKPEKYLNHLYGKNWRIPKKNFIWYKDAKSIISIDQT